MIEKLQKHGDSYVVAIDKALMEQLGIGPETPLQVTVSDGSLVLSPVVQGAGEDKVASALARIRSQPGYPEMLSNLAK